MSPSGWMIMVLSVTGMSGFFGWCIWRVLTRPGTSAHLHSPADIEPPDLGT